MASASSTKPSFAAETSKPIIIGIYGIDGSGKTHTVQRLKVNAEITDNFLFFEDSKVINDLVLGGLDAFKTLPKANRDMWRERAVTHVRNTCIVEGKHGIIAGHALIWEEGEKGGEVTITEADLATYTHVIYIDTPPEEIIQFREKDDREAIQKRTPTSLQHLNEWQKAEKTILRAMCVKSGILFASVSPPDLANKVTEMVLDVLKPLEQINLWGLEKLVDLYAAELRVKRGDRMLVIDGDNLVKHDTGHVIWRKVPDPLDYKFGDRHSLSHKFNSASQFLDEGNEMPSPFQGPLGFTFKSLLQLSHLYAELEEQHGVAAVNDLCDAIASREEYRVNPEICDWLKQVCGDDRNGYDREHIAIFVITASYAPLWKRIIKEADIDPRYVRVMGSALPLPAWDQEKKLKPRIKQHLLAVTAEAKAAMVNRLQTAHQCHVVAFGDNISDLPMLLKADQAVIVVTGETIRSTSMPEALKKATNNGELFARQLLLGTRIALLNPETLPPFDLDVNQFLKEKDAVIGRQYRTKPQAPRTFLACTRNTSSWNLLMSPTRDARVAGQDLRADHQRIGWYLATEIISEIIGLETNTIPHVQGHAISGYRLRSEQDTLIMALMRGGGPMAFGVNEAFPLARFMHAKEPVEVDKKHLAGCRTVILVDSVINEGGSMVKFIKHIRGIEGMKDLRIVMVAGVIQEKAIVSETLAELLKGDVNLSLVGLRVSDNKFTGTKTVDTGNRLFNTTHLA